MTELDEKIKELFDLNGSIVFIEYYTHTNKYMYKILNSFTNFKEDKRVICEISSGIRYAVEVALEVIKQEKEKFNNKN